MHCIHRDLCYSDDVEELNYLKREKDRLLRYDDIVSCRSSETRLLDVRIPSRAYEGSTFEIRVPGDDRLLTVRVPRGAVPGDVVTVRYSPSYIGRRRKRRRDVSYDLDSTTRYNDDVPLLRHD